MKDDHRQNEAEIFLASHPDVEVIDAITPDLCGIIRGKRVSRDQLPKVMDDGLQIPASILLLDVCGECFDAGGRGFSDGDPDEVARPIPGTLTVTPWAPKPTGQVMLQFFKEDGTPSDIDPRHILNKVVQRFKDTGYKPVTALELEFYLVDPSRPRGAEPKPPRLPGSKRRLYGTQVLSISELENLDDFLNDITLSCKAQNIPVGPVTAEYATGQFEINLMHTDDMLAAADHAILLQRVIRGVAIKHGFEATFMAKPYLDKAGNGLHIHLSLYDQDGANVFDDGTPDGGEVLRHAVGGLLETLYESMAFIAPNINSYRRFQPNLYVPVNKSWGVNNRSVAIRIPGGDGKNRRLEHRVPGADANPYLALAAVLAGAHYGVTNKITPPPAATGNAGSTADADMPLRWRAALDALAGGTILPDYLGQDYCDLYIACKQGEMDNFYSHISSLEYEWYMRTE